MNDPLDELFKKAEAEFPAMIERATKKLHQLAFADFDCGELRKMTDKELAAWQAKHQMDSPQYIIALQEWNRRATAEQIKWGRYTAFITATASIIAALLGAWAGATWTKSQQQTQIKPPIAESYKSPAELWGVHQVIERTKSQPIEKKTK